MLGISNIAFGDCAASWALLTDFGLTQIEVAPTVLCPWSQFNATIVRQYELDHNVKVFSLQSVFYNTDIVIAKDPDGARKHLCRVLQVCKEADISKITFGSPKSRVIRPGTGCVDAECIRAFIYDCALKFPDVSICVEPNARVYGCNYLTTLAEVVEFVLSIDLPNVKVQLDVGNFILETDTLDSIRTHAYLIGAVHISDKHLLHLEDAETHQTIAQYLTNIQYSGPISLEMRQTTLKELATAIKLVHKWYPDVQTNQNPSCLVGYTGFVGGNLRDQLYFDEYINRVNLESLRGRHMGTVYFAAMPGSMWHANSHATDDFAALQLYWNVLKTVHADKFVLISSMNVYGNARHVTELDSPKPITVYGQHRLLLEQLVTQRFDCTFVVRLPGLFGPHLKKNAIYDVAHGHRLEFVNLAAVYQWYDLQWLSDDMAMLWSARKTHSLIVNITTPPVPTSQIAALSDRDTTKCRNVPTEFSPHIQSTKGYVRTLEYVLDHIKQYFNHHK